MILTPTGEMAQGEAGRGQGWKGDGRDEGYTGWGQASRRQGAPLSFGFGFGSETAAATEARLRSLGF